MESSNINEKNTILGEMCDSKTGYPTQIRQRRVYNPFLRTSELRLEQLWQYSDGTKEWHPVEIIDE